jgi:FtsX-like permease family
VALVVIALVAIWQLRRYQAVSRSTQGSLTIDPVLTAAPVLALAAGTAVLLRLLPLTARIGDWLAARGRRLGAAMASWEISRRPVRQGASVLLVVLAAATSTLALAQHESWRRSVADQAAFSVGADVRVDTLVTARPDLTARISRGPGVLGAMPVALPASNGSGQILALNARSAAATVLLRPDLSGLGPAALWRRIVPRVTGLAVPGRPARLAVSARLSRSAAKSSPLQVTLDVLDATGVSYSLPAGLLPADGRVHRLAAVISPRRRAVYPLRLTGISLAYTLAATKTPTAMLTVGGIAAANGTAGPFAAPFSTGRALSRWAARMSAPGLGQAVDNALSPHEPLAGPEDVVGFLSVRAGELLNFAPGYGVLGNGVGLPSPIPGTLTLSAPPLTGVARAAGGRGAGGTPGATAAARAAGTIPAIATRAYLSAAAVPVGGTLNLTLGTASVRVRIVGAVTRFPTVSGEGGGLIVDLAALQSVLTSQNAGILPVSQWWLRTRQAAVPGRWPAGLPAGTTVESRTAAAAALLADPLSGLPQQALPAIALAAAALAAVGFSVSVAAGVRERRGQRALLAALGVSRAAQARQLCLEQLLLSMPAAGAGLLLGAGLAQLLVQAVTLTATATAPVPTVLIEIPWVLAAGLAVAVAVIPVLAAALTIARRPDPAAQLRAAESV